MTVRAKTFEATEIVLIDCCVLSDVDAVDVVSSKHVGIFESRTPSMDS